MSAKKSTKKAAPKTAPAPAQLLLGAPPKQVVNIHTLNVQTLNIQ